MTRILTAALVTTLLGGSAFAQDAVPEAAPMPAPEPAPAPAPAPAPLADPAPMTPVDVSPPAAAPSADTGLKISMFADSYYNWSTTKNTDAAGMPSGQPAHRAYNRYNGFGLSFLGADIVYDTEKFGATASLRFGPSVPIFYAADKGLTGIDNITQAYVTYKPTSALAIDFGQFSTIYGAEVAESWKNLNYTRGGLYYAMQPFWHTGVRAKYSITDELSLTAMVVNGVNSEIDVGKERPSIGVQAAYAKDNVAVLLGYLGNLDPDNNVGGDAYFDHFVDLVATAGFGNVSLVFNGDYAKADDAQFYGASLAARLGLTDELGIAARVEYLGDPDGLIWVTEAGENNVITATGTFEFKPDASGRLIIRWDNRFEKSKEQIFTGRDGAGADSWFQSVLGLVVTSS